MLPAESNPGSSDAENRQPTSGGAPRCPECGRVPETTGLEALALLRL